MMCLMCSGCSIGNTEKRVEMTTMHLGRYFRLIMAGLAASLMFPAFAIAQDWSHGIATIGDLKYKPGFAHFDYVNPDAPKGGSLSLSQLGTFDSLNPVLNKGNLATGLGMVYEPLVKRSLDEAFSSYGLIAESLSYPDDFSSVSFRLNPKAKWADGQPITVDDVIFSFDKAKEYDQSKFFYYQHVTGAKASGEREVTFTFDLKDNSELPNIMGDLLILPKHWWEGQDANGKKRDISATTLEPVMGSGPYRIAAMKPGASMRFELRDDYWGKDLNVNIGSNNFKTIE
jgi:microcin C transport system substrate-binding protein